MSRELLKMKINELKPYSRNAKKHSKQQIDLIAKSIKEFGFRQPIVIDKNKEIIIGHARLEAAKQLGLKDVPVIDAGDLSPQQTKALRLADNKLAELAQWDIDLAIEELKGLDDNLFDLTGFDREQIESISNENEINDLSRDKNIDLGEYDVLTVEAPEAPRLKARVSFYTKDISQFDKLKNYFNCKNGVMDLDKLLDIIK